ARVDVIAAYPITPQTFIVEHLSEFVNDGLLDASFMRVESEHSAMSACVSASATGVRTYTATASQGLALMHEVLFIAGSAHLPVVMPVVNRTVAGPIGIWAEHNDTMPQRDCGWLQVYVEDNQEVLDMTIQAFKIAEDKRVLLPIMVCLDAFILSHTVEPVDFPDQDKVDDFLPTYRPEHAVLDPKDPMVIGSFSPPEYIQEVRYQTDEMMRNALEVVGEVNDEWAKIFGRDYGGLIEEYKTDGADAILITLGTVTSTARDIVDEYRAQGKKVGLVKLRFFRPYPTEAIRKVAEKCKAIGVYDRAVSFSAGGPSWIEARSALYGHTIPIINVLAGIGGRDVTAPDIRLMFDKILEAAEKGKAENEIVWIGTRGVQP
ncbi:MAG: pyruvate ferredoxin oxidoreductase, partial [Thermoplasmata archaeon]|nr:pyruvate ferredoxin oxidoreductase [Thermoplasmata archaeon]